MTAQEDAYEELPGAEQVDLFCDALKHESNCSDHTIRAYRTDILDFLRFMKRQGIDPFDATHRHLRLYLGEMDAARYSRRTLNRRLSSVRHFLEWASIEGIAKSNAASTISGPKISSKLPKTIRSDQMDRLLSVHAAFDAEGKPRDRSASELRDQAVLELLYACGLRISEVAGLNLGSVDMGQGIVRVFGKGSKERIVPIHDKAMDAIKEYLDGARDELRGSSQIDALFLSSRGNRYSAQAIRKMFKDALAEAGLDSSLTPHAVRHSFATDVLSGGADLRSVQEMLGHSSLSTTQIYTHISPERLKEAHSKSHPRG